MNAANTLGAKHTCAGCAGRFYDMNKSPATCPRCDKKVAAKIKKVSKRSRSRVHPDDK